MFSEETLRLYCTIAFILGLLTSEIERLIDKLIDKFHKWYHKKGDNDV